MERIILIENNLASDNHNWNALFSRLTSPRQIQISKNLRVPDRQIRSLVYLVLEKILYSDLELDPAEHPIIQGYEGKPYISGVSGLHFNLSHSSRMAALAISEKEIGIDIQKPKTYDSTIALEFFHDHEYSFLQKSCSSEQENLFYKLWTLKESYLKAIGKGLFKPLSSFSLIDEEMAWRSRIEDNNNTDPWYLHHEITGSGYHLAICRKNTTSNPWQYDLIRATTEHGVPNIEQILCSVKRS